MRPLANALIGLGLLAVPASLSAALGPWQDSEQEQAAEEEEEKAPDEAENAGETQAKADQEEELICKSLAVTGTRFKRRFCRTAVEWERIRNGMSDVADEMRRDGAQRVVEDGNNPGSGVPSADPQ